MIQFKPWAVPHLWISVLLSFWYQASLSGLRGITVANIAVTSIASPCCTNCWSGSVSTIAIPVVSVASQDWHQLLQSLLYQLLGRIGINYCKSMLCQLLIRIGINYCKSRLYRLLVRNGTNYCSPRCINKCKYRHQVFLISSLLGVKSSWTLTFATTAFPVFRMSCLWLDVGVD